MYVYILSVLCGCRPLSYPDSDVLLICFSIVNPVSLANVVDRWLPEVSHFCPKVPFILVGTKKDLRTDPRVLESLSLTKEKPVTTEQGQQVAALINAHAYLECSSRTREGVRQVFETATLAALRKRKPWSSSRARCRILWFYRVFVLHLNCCVFSGAVMFALGCRVFTRLITRSTGQLLRALSEYLILKCVFQTDRLRFFTDQIFCCTVWCKKQLESKRYNYNTVCGMLTNFDSFFMARFGSKSTIVIY